YPEVSAPAGEPFRLACRQCHVLPDPQRHTAAEWRIVVARMQKNMEWMNRVVGSKRMPGEPQLRIEDINAFLAKHARKKWQESFSLQPAEQGLGGGLPRLVEHDRVADAAQQPVLGAEHARARLGLAVRNQAVLFGAEHERGHARAAEQARQAPARHV